MVDRQRVFDHLRNFFAFIGQRETVRLVQQKAGSCVGRFLLFRLRGRLFIDCVGFAVLARKLFGHGEAEGQQILIRSSPCPIHLFLTPERFPSTKFIISNGNRTPVVFPPPVFMSSATADFISSSLSWMKS